MIINDPKIVGEVTQAFESYETALMENNIDVLNSLFWNSPLVLRHGIDKTAYGFTEISNFRANRVGGSPPRQIVNRTITTFGTDFATTSVEFLRLGEARRGRQSQTWLRLAEGWRIVAAHVSLAAETP